jgi:organic radical activating enzyme
MALLPSADNLGRRDFTDRSQVVRPQLDFGGQNRFAATLENVSNNINERLDRASLTKATIEFQKAKLDADNAFDNDPDFETHEQRYNESLGKAAESISKTVRNPAMRDEFSQRLALYQAEGSANIKKKAFVKETEKGLADLDSNLTVSRENYLRSSSQADKELARQSMIDSIDFAKQSGYIDDAKAEALHQKAGLDLAVASVKIESPDRQIKLLTEHKGLADIIPTDMRMEMIDRAKSDMKNTEALTLAEEIGGKGGDLSYQLSLTKSIKDPLVRENTRAQVEENFGRKHRAKTEREYNAYDFIKKLVLDTEKPISPLEASVKNKELWNTMSASQQQDILSMSGGERKYSDMNVYNNLNQLADKNPKQAYQYYLENADKLSHSDQEKWSDRLSKPEELKSFLSNQEMLKKSMVDIGIKDFKGEKFAKASEQLNEDFIKFQQDNGHEPNAVEMKKLVDGITDKVVEGSWNPLSSKPFGGDVYGFEVTKAEREKRSNDAETNRKLDKFKTLLGQYRDALEKQQNAGKTTPGIPVVIPDDEQNRLYNIWSNKGYLDADN